MVCFVWQENQKQYRCTVVKIQAAYRFKYYLLLLMSHLIHLRLTKGTLRLISFFSFLIFSHTQKKSMWKKITTSILQCMIKIHESLQLKILNFIRLCEALSKLYKKNDVYTSRPPRKLTLEDPVPILYTFDWFGLVWWVLWHINFCRLFNTKSVFI